MAVGRGGRDGRRSGPGKVDDGGDEAEDGMQGSRSEALDERGRSLVMDGGVEVSAPAWWRRTVVDGVADVSGRRRVGWRGCFGARGVRMGKREVERKGGTMLSGPDFRDINFQKMALVLTSPRITVS